MPGQPDGDVAHVTPPPGATPSARVPVLLRAPATADSLTVARQVAAGVAHAAGMEDERVEDVRIAVTEACTNAVRHAYASGEPGVLTLASWVAAGSLFFSVRDRGRGFGEGEEGPGVGLLTIRALAGEVDVRSSPLGTEVTMRFPLVPYG